MWDTARKLSKKLKERNDGRQKAVHVQTFNKLRNKQKEKFDQNLKEEEIKKTCLRELQEKDMKAWITKYQANKEFDKIKTQNNITENKKIGLLRIPLNFYHHIIHSGKKLKPALYTVTGCNSGKLFEKVLNLIDFTIEDDSDYVNPTVLKNEELRNKIFDLQKTELHDKILKNRLAVHMKNKKIIQLPILEKFPEKLVGCRIQHKLKECRENEETWCLGKVIACEQKEPLINSVFKTIYDDDDDPDEYEFQLILDLIKNDLIILDDLK